MSGRWARRSRRALAIVTGIAVGSVVVFSADALGDRDHPGPPPSPPPAVEQARLTMPELPVTFLVSSPEGLPPGLEKRLAKIPGVLTATRIHAQLEWMSESRSADGAVVDAPRGGRAIPMEIAGVDPREYARFVPPAERAAVRSLADDDMLLAETSARLRRGGEGMRMKFQTWRRVAGVIADESTGGYEAIVPIDHLDHRDRVDEYLLAQLDTPARRDAIERRLERLLAGRPYRTRIQGEAAFLRYGDAVLPQLMVKHFFGEFAAKPHPDGTIEIDPGWVRGNLVTTTLPLAGTVTCHRSVVPQLRAAFRAIEAEGLSFAIDSGQYAGCFGPRFVNGDPTGRLSHHAWAIAIDINVASNPFGARPRQDPRLVQVLESHGFTWGGRWLLPDGMHFEWIRP